MGATVTATFLSGLPLFQEVPSESLGRIEDSTAHVALPAQEYLFRADEPASSLYIVLSGRLQVVSPDGEVLREIGAGAVLGELAVLTGTPRSAAVRALRDSELLSVDAGAFDALLADDPALGLALLRRLARQLQESGGLRLAEAAPAVFTVVPLAESEGIDAFRRDLETAFGELGSVAVLDRARADEEGLTPGKALARLEAAHDRVLLFAEGSEEWSSFAIRQADRLVVVAAGTARPRPAERLAGAELVLVKPVSAASIGEWLDALRPRAHYLVDPQRRAEGTRRAARRMTRNALGLVLSGGGARGFAHIGAVEVLTESGFEIDRIGGCSIGSFIGAMAAAGWDASRMRDVCREELVRRSPFSDYTLPRVSLIRARRATSMLQRVFGDARLEELPRPLYTVSADLISSELVVHRRGPLWEAVGASMAIPGLAPPQPFGSRLLVDGGVLNNLPVDLMADAKEGPVVAVDVIRKADVTGESERPPLPSIMETLSRATVLGSAERAERNRTLAALTIVPEVQAIALRDFSQLDRAIESGRTAAAAALDEGGRDLLRRALAS